MVIPPVLNAGRFIAMATTTVLVVLLLRFEAGVFFLVTVGVLLSMIFRGFTRRLVRHVRLPRSVAMAAVVILSLGLTAGAVRLLGASLVQQLQALIARLPTLFHDLVRSLEQTYIARELGKRALDQPVGPDARTVVSGASDVVAGSARLIAGVIVAFFIGVYGAAQPLAYVTPLLRLVPPPRRARALETLREIDEVVTRWLMGRLLAMLFVGIVTTTGLWLLGEPASLALGVLAGALTFVEYLGPLASAVAPILVALTRGPLLALWVLLLFLAVHVLDGYVVSPLIAKRMTRLPPGFTLTAQVLLGSIFGPGGVALATPISIGSAILVRRLYVEDILDDCEPSQTGAPPQGSSVPHRLQGPG